MSKNSSRQNYQAFQEWHAWAKTKYPAFRVQKKKPQVPDWMRGIEYEG